MTNEEDEDEDEDEDEGEGEDEAPEICKNVKKWKNIAA